MPVTHLPAPIVENSNEKIFDTKGEYILYLENGNLVLKNDEESIILAENQSYELTEELPKMHLISEGERKYILITLVWSTNKIGSTVSMWLYDCLNEEVHIIDDGLELVDYFVHKNGNIYILEIPQYAVKFDVDIVQDYKDIFPARGQLEFSRFTNYKIESDGTIVLERWIFTGAMNWLESFIMTTVYDIVDGEFVPVSFSIR